MYSVLELLNYVFDEFSVWEMSKQQVLIVAEGHTPTHMNIVSKSRDEFVGMLNFLFEKHPTKSILILYVK